jgi:IclR family acetate operon transcriptional repressor
VVEPGPRYPIESVDNALRLLLMFERGEPIRVNTAARELGVASSTAHRLMAMLQAHKLVSQDPQTKAYVAGPALFGLSSAIVRGFDVRAVAHPVLEKLSRETGETAALAILEGSQATFIDAVESPHAVRVTSRVGMSLPASTTSVGKALLAGLSSEQLRVLFPKLKLPTLTDRSLRDRSELEGVLDRVRELGYSTNDGESEDGIGSVASPIRGRQGQTLAAVSVAGPVTRLRAKTDDLAARVVRAADEISAQLV